MLPEYADETSQCRPEPFNRWLHSLRWNHLIIDKQLPSARQVEDGHRGDRGFGNAPNDRWPASLLSIPLLLVVTLLTFVLRASPRATLPAPSSAPTAHRNNASPSQAASAWHRPNAAFNPAHRQGHALTGDFGEVVCYRGVVSWILNPRLGVTLSIMTSIILIYILRWAAILAMFLRLLVQPSCLGTDLPVKLTTSSPRRPQAGRGAPHAWRHRHPASDEAPRPVSLSKMPVRRSLKVSNIYFSFSDLPSPVSSNGRRWPKAGGGREHHSLSPLSGHFKRHPLVPPKEGGRGRVQMSKRKRHPGGREFAAGCWRSPSRE